MIPVYNEVGNVRILHERLVKVMKRLRKKFEIVFVDDGSRDGTYQELLKLSPVTIIRFRKNFGQTAAMSAGFEHAKGRLIVYMDGDLQNDPEDIPRLIRRMKETNADMVTGWRKHRKDSFLKRLFSRFANSFRNLLIRDPVHDSGCSLKVFKKECFDDLDLIGEMHRYIPALLGWKGFSIAELPVKHYPRHSGKTKYGAKRLLKGLIDLISVWFWRKFSGRPLHIFGGIGILLGSIGFILAYITLILKIVNNIDLSSSFLPYLSIFLVILGVQFFVSGILADIAIKTYYRAGKTHNYNIRQITTNP